MRKGIYSVIGIIFSVISATATVLDDDNVAFLYFDEEGSDPFVSRNFSLLGGSYADLGEFPHWCLGNFSRCENGLSLDMWIKFINVTETADDIVVLTSGGHSHYSNGIYLIQRFGDEYELGASLENDQWSVTFHLIPEQWTHLRLSWSTDSGLRVFVDGAMLTDIQAHHRDYEETPFDTFPDFVVGIDGYGLPHDDEVRFRMKRIGVFNRAIMWTHEASTELPAVDEITYIGCSAQTAAGEAMPFTERVIAVQNCRHHCSSKGYSVSFLNSQKECACRTPQDTELKSPDECDFKVDWSVYTASAARYTHDNYDLTVTIRKLGSREYVKPGESVLIMLHPNFNVEVPFDVDFGDGTKKELSETEFSYAWTSSGTKVVTVETTVGVVGVTGQAEFTIEAVDEGRKGDFALVTGFHERETNHGVVDFYSIDQQIDSCFVDLGYGKASSRIDYEDLADYVENFTTSHSFPNFGKYYFTAQCENDYGEITNASDFLSRKFEISHHYLLTTDSFTTYIAGDKTFHGTLHLEHNDEDNVILPMKDSNEVTILASNLHLSDNIIDYTYKNISIDRRILNVQSALHQPSIYSEMFNGDWNLTTNISVRIPAGNNIFINASFSLGEETDQLMYIHFSPYDIVVTFELDFTTLGYYPVLVNTSNDLSTNTTDDLISVEVPIISMSLSTSNITDNTLPIQLNIMLNEGERGPMKANFEIDHDNGHSGIYRTYREDYYFPAYLHEYIYPDWGIYNLCVRAFNEISSVVECIVIQIGQKITYIDIQTSTPARVTTGEPAVFNIRAPKGSDKIYTVDFGDGEVFVFTDRYLKGTQNFQTTTTEKVTTATAQNETTVAAVRGGNATDSGNSTVATSASINGTNSNSSSQTALTRRKRAATDNTTTDTTTVTFFTNTTNVMTFINSSQTSSTSPAGSSDNNITTSNASTTSEPTTAPPSTTTTTPTRTTTPYNIPDNAVDPYSTNDSTATRLRDWSIEVTHIYRVPAIYTVKTVVHNSFNFAKNTLCPPVIVDDADTSMCQGPPVLSLGSLQSSLENPLQRVRAEQIDLSAGVKLKCEGKFKKATFSWKAVRVVSEGSETVERTLHQICDLEQDENTLSIPPVSLTFGLYKITLTAAPKGLSVIASMADFYVKVNPSPPVAHLEGSDDTAKWFLLYGTTTADFRKSKDPDFDTTDGLEFDIFCFQEDDRGDVIKETFEDLKFHSRLLLETTTYKYTSKNPARLYEYNQCFQENENFTRDVTIPRGELLVPSDYFITEKSSFGFKLFVTKEGRTTSTMMIFEIRLSNSTNLLDQLADLLKSKDTSGVLRAVSYLTEGLGGGESNDTSDTEAKEERAELKAKLINALDTVSSGVKDVGQCDGMLNLVGTLTSDSSELTQTARVGATSAIKNTAKVAEEFKDEPKEVMTDIGQKVVSGVANVIPKEDPTEKLIEESRKARELVTAEEEARQGQQQAEDSGTPDISLDEEDTDPSSGQTDGQQTTQASGGQQMETTTLQGGQQDEATTQQGTTTILGGGQHQGITTPTTNETVGNNQTQQGQQGNQTNNGQQTGGQQNQESSQQPQTTVQTTTVTQQPQYPQQGGEEEYDQQGQLVTRPPPPPEEEEEAPPAVPGTARHFRELLKRCNLLANRPLDTLYEYLVYYDSIFRTVIKNKSEEIMISKEILNLQRDEIFCYLGILEEPLDLEWYVNRFLHEEKRRRAIEKKNADRGVSNSFLNAVDSVSAVLLNKTEGNESTELAAPGLKVKMKKVDANGTEDEDDGEDEGIKMPGSVLAGSGANDTNGTQVGQTVIVNDVSPFTYGDNSDTVGSSVVSVKFSSGEGEEVKVSNATEPMSIYVDGDGKTNPNQYTLRVNRGDSDSKFNYHSIILRNNDSSIHAEFRPKQDEEFVVFIAYEEFPNDTFYEYKETLPLPEDAFSNVSNPIKRDRLRHTFFPPQEVTRLNGTYKLGIKVKVLTIDFGDEFTAFNYTLDVYVRGCRFWNTEKETWETQGCRVGPLTNQNKTQCLCTHLTSFGGDVAVPPNTIDFKNVWSKFKNLNENAAVFSTVVSLIGIYIIVLIYARHMDKKDVLKWGATPLEDNLPTDNYHYQITVQTGMRKHATTESNISFIISGERQDSGVRRLFDGKRKRFERGSILNFILSTENALGALNYMRIWHDNSAKGKLKGWFLDQVQITDLQTGERYFFLASRWFAVEEDDGMVDRIVPVAGIDDLVAFKQLFTSSVRKKITSDHLWFSVFSRPTRSSFTRVQRITCCMSLLFLTMITNAMWFKGDGEDSQQPVTALKIGPFQFTLQQVFISLASTIIVFPPSFVLITLFRRSKQKKNTVMQRHQQMPKRGKWKNVTSSSGMGSTSQIWGEQPKVSRFKKFKQSIQDLLSRQQASKYAGVDENFDAIPQTTIAGDPNAKKEKQKKKKKASMLPHWCMYIAWVLAFFTIIVPGFFTILYSMEWGKEKANQWLTTFVLSFFQSVIVVQPIKVLCLVAFIACVLKKPDIEEEGDCGDELNNAIASHDEEMMVKGDDKINEIAMRRREANMEFEPPDPQKLEEARQTRLNEIKMEAVLKEIFVYLFFVLVLFFISYNQRDSTGFDYAENLKNLFTGKYFENVKTVSSYWDWLEMYLLPTLFVAKYHNGTKIDYWWERRCIADLEARRIGIARLRQLRVKNASCSVQSELAPLIHHCRDEYGWTDDDAGTYLPRWQKPTEEQLEELQDLESPDPWVYSSALKLKNAPYMATINTYKGGGFVVNFERSYRRTVRNLTRLRQEDWLDVNTRAIFLEFTVYNPNLNLFAAGILMHEFTATGSAIPRSEIKVFRLMSYVGSFGIVVIFFEVLYCGFTLYFFYRCMSRVKKLKCKYFRQFWDILEFVNMVFAVTVIAMYALKHIITKVSIEALKATAKAEFINFQSIALYDETFNYMVALVVFLATIQFLKLLQFNKKMNMLGETVKIATKDLKVFSVAALLYFFAFTAGGYLLFGQDLLEYNGVIQSAESMFAFSLGSFDFEAMEGVNKILGPLFFFMFILVIYVGVMSIFLTIIGDAFNQVKEETEGKQNEYEIVDFIWRRFKQVIGVK